MRKIPFHRKILPWIFFITFLGVAPALVFYTAGYRWNPKKAKIERYGTVIIDSVPSDADIYIDGRPLNKQTPTTIQNMPPGLHQFEISKNGYFPWKKSLDVFPEYVTFANDITLWKQSQPTLLFQLPSGHMRLSPDARELLFVSSSATSTEVRRINIRAATQTVLSAPTIALKDISWSPNESYAVLEPETSTESPWLIDTSGTQKPLELPAGQYRWENQRLVGNEGHSLLNIRLSDFSLSRTVLPSNHIDRLQQNILFMATGTHDVAFVAAGDQTHGFLLPNAAWNFWQITNNMILLRSEASWLSLIKKGASYEFHTAQGDVLRQNPSSSYSNYLLIHQNELWLWDPHTEPDLLRRQSDRLVDVAWHTQGTTLFYATEHDVIALNLDPRSGRLETVLSHFDHIDSLAYASKKLYVLATQQGVTGLWTLSTE